MPGAEKWKRSGKRRVHDRRRVCRGCGERRALFVFRGRARGDAGHDLCPRCYRSLLDRLHALDLAADQAA